MDLLQAAGRLARALLRRLPPGPTVVGAADRRQERARLFKVFTLGGLGGHSATPPRGSPPENLPGDRPDRPYD